ncbi:cyclic nucleotide-binding domain-containing protein [candidate division KSB1 bacterium]
MSLFQQRTYRKGAVIFFEGEKDNGEIFVVQDGHVEVNQTVYEGTTRTLSTIGKGGVFGIISAMTKSARMASAEARSDVKLLVIQAGDLEKIITSQPAFGTKILSNLSNLLRNLNDQVKRFMAAEEKTAGPDQLLNIGEYYFLTGRFVQAEYALQSYLKYNPDAPRTDETKDMLAHLEEVKARDDFQPSELLANQYEAGRYFLGKKQFGRAFPIFNEIISSHPKHALANQIKFEMGKAQYQLGKFRDSLNIFEELQNAVPDDIDVNELIFEIANCHKSLEAWTTAVTVYGQVVKSESPLRDEAQKEINIIKEKKSSLF